MPRSLKDVKWEKPRSLRETIYQLPSPARPLGVFEWGMDWAYFLLERSALFRGIVQLVIVVPVVTSIIAIGLDINEREEERILRAWDLLMHAKKQGNFGQKDAVEQLIKRDKSLRHVDLTDADLHSAKLKGVDLKKAVLMDVDMSYADLTGADLREAVLLGTDLTNANLSHADLRGAVFKLEASSVRSGQYATLTGANLQGANLEGTQLTGRMRGVNLRNANLKRADLSFADLRDCVLKGAKTSSTRFYAADFSGVDLSDIDFGSLDDVRSIDVAGANLGSAQGLDATTLRKLDNWLLAYVNSDRTKSLGLPQDHNERIKKKDFSGLNLEGANLEFANLYGANFQQADLTGANFHGANLQRADLRGANLTNATLRGESMNLRGADFRGARLTNVRWQRDVNWKHANFEGVVDPPRGLLEVALEEGAVAIADDREWEKVIKANSQQP